MRWLRRLTLALAVAIAVAAGGLVWLDSRRPDLTPFDEFLLPEVAGDGLRVRFLGVSTLIFSDGETQVMTDGFVSRPGLWSVAFGEIAPDPDRIAEALERARVANLAVVIPVHSHYDHAMDAPEVARRTGALLLGSESTANVGRGGGLPESQIAVAEPGVPHRFGAFEVTLLPSRHVDFGANRGSLGGTIDAPLVPPARALEWAEGTTWSVLISHPLGNALVQGSAGFMPGSLAGRRADVVYLGMGGLGAKDEAYQRAYLEEVVDAVGAKVVVPIHWDDFTLPLEEGLVALPDVLSDTAGPLRMLLAWAEGAPGRRFGFPALWRATAPYPAPVPSSLSTSSSSGKRPDASLEKTSRPSAWTSKIPLSPRTSSDSAPVASRIAAARLVALGR